MRTVFALLTAFLALMSSSIAAGVTPVSGVTRARAAEVSVTTNPASRAQTEVQVRRLHSLLVSKHAAGDASDHYRRLQQRLRVVK
ncbi:MAG: hypothetical protein FJ146_05005 [Deltaproteobacteria bacterium]|nr:hypothetical protein [Deltaproteobacteria bacterium]